MLQPCDGRPDASRLGAYMLSLRHFLLPLVHGAAFTAIYLASYQLRFDFAVPASAAEIFWQTLPLMVALKFAVFYYSGNYHGWWRYVTFADLTAIVRAATLHLLLIAGIDYFVMTDIQIPRAILLLDWMLTIVILGGLRSCVRFSREHFWPFFSGASNSNALFVGADESSAALAVRIHNDQRLPFRIVGFLDEDRLKHGSRLGGIPVLGDPIDAPRIAADHRATLVLVTGGRLTGQAMRELVARCEQAELKVKVLPAIETFLSGNHKIQLRDVDINDLLRREPAELDCAAIGELLKDKTVMVTGAGGSIGSEICRQVLKFHPKDLVLVEKTENSLFFIDQELQALHSSSVIHPCVADLLDRPRMNTLFARHRPAVVFHAAAHKHVPLMECNVGEAIKNNIVGSKRLADLAHEFGVQSFVLISTDKAVNPTSVMGATKQMAERYIHALSQDSHTRFIAVRFGNVLGSTGSVVPIFREQLRKGEPITITDPRMTRYFMTIPEASQLVLQAGAMGRGGEIFVLNMGEPVKILDLAHDVIRLSGLALENVDIQFTGIRPGEKLFEELYFDDERTLETRHPKVRAAYHRPYEMNKVAEEIQTLADLANGPHGPILSKLSEYVSEFQTYLATRVVATQENPNNSFDSAPTDKLMKPLKT